MMRVLVTGAASRLAAEIIRELEGDHQLRLLDDCVAAGNEAGEWVQGSLLDPGTAQRAVEGMDAVIHTGEVPPDLPQEELVREQVLLDLATRGTDVLLRAGVAAGVKRFVYGSTLEIFSAYPDTVCVTELYKPLPTPETGQMSRYLGELVCREFARVNPVTITALRLGKLVLEEEVAGAKLDMMWLDWRDGAQAFVMALERDTSAALEWVKRWAVYHICAPLANPKYLIGAAEGAGYRPKHTFGSEGGQE